MNRINPMVITNRKYNKSIAFYFEVENLCPGNCVIAGPALAVNDGTVENYPQTVLVS